MSHILRLGDPRLREISEPIVHPDPELGRYCSELAAVLHDFRERHGWGRAVALPQLGISKRVVAFRLGSDIQFALNPSIEEPSSEMFEVWDDCMCLPSIAVRVLRHRSLRVSFTDEHGRAQIWSRVPESVAELVQHEVDHLNGILLTDRMLGPWGVIAREMRSVAPTAPGTPVHLG